jgi:hypothetical protein
MRYERETDRVKRVDGRIETLHVGYQSFLSPAHQSGKTKNLETPTQQIFAA